METYKGDALHLQLVVFGNGKAGAVGEHSMMDAMPLFRLTSAVVAGVFRVGTITGTGTDSENILSTYRAKAPPPPSPWTVFRGSQIFSAKRPICGKQGLVGLF